MSSYRKWREVRRTVPVHEPQIWVLEDESLVVEVFIGTKAEADDRATWLNAERGTPGDVTAVAYPVTTFEHGRS